MNVVVIIPTYNEKENIGPLIEMLQEVFDRIDHAMTILVVDDNSPDGTTEVVRRAAMTHPNVHLITGKKKGLGAAYVRGMRYAMQTLHADVVVEMDADFSHNPEDIPRLIAVLDQGVDFVIGSRYISGGTIPADWGFKRKFLSRWGNRLARYLGGLHRIRDCTAGFRVIRTNLIAEIDFSRFRAQGYAFQIALLSKAAKKNALIQEVPVTFKDRTKGCTTMQLSDIYEFILNCFWIRFEDSTVFIKFIIIGSSGVLVNLAAFTLLLGTGLNKYVASLSAIALSIVSNSLVKYFWSNASAKTPDASDLKDMLFDGLSMLSLALSFASFGILSALFPEVRPHMIQLIGLIPAIFVNFFFDRHLTFKTIRVRAD